MFRRITESQLRGVTLNAYRKFRLVPAGSEDGTDLYIRPTERLTMGSSQLPYLPFAYNTLLIEVANPLDAETQRRIQAWITPAAN